jgi:hypothetical protein
MRVMTWRALSISLYPLGYAWEPTLGSDGQRVLSWVHGRGFHSSTSQLSLSRYCHGNCMKSFGVAHRLTGRVYVELKSGRV